MRRRGLMSVALAAWLILWPAVATDEGARRYSELYEAAISGSADVDFVRLRDLFTEQPEYTGYINVNAEYRSETSAMLEAGSEKNWERVLQHGKRVLELAPLDLQAHSYCARAYFELADDPSGRKHQRMFVGLKDSILDHGDGKTPASAFHVITLTEEYHLLIILGITASGRCDQATFREAGRRYDSLTCEHDRTKEEVTLYFEIDKLSSGPGKRDTGSDSDAD